MKAQLRWRLVATKNTKSGSAPTRKRGRGADPELMRATLVEAAASSLREAGFGGTTARSIAERATCNQAAIYYHFGGIDSLLLAALEKGSAARLARYKIALDGERDLPALVATLQELHAEDVASGHLAVLSELLGGITANPDLRLGIEESTQPWIEFIEKQIEEAARSLSFGSVLPTADLADLVFSLVMGVELRNKLDGQVDRSDRIFRFAALLATLVQSQQPAE